MVFTFIWTQTHASKYRKTLQTRGFFLSTTIIIDMWKNQNLLFHGHLLNADKNRCTVQFDRFV